VGDLEHQRQGIEMKSEAESAHASAAGFDAVHGDILLFFSELVIELGGDPEPLLRHVGIHAGDVSQVGYRTFVNLLEHAASELKCADFGLRLAARQGGGGVFGAMGVVMQNSMTLGAALDYVTKHTHAHSLAARVRLERDPFAQTIFVGHDILLDGLPNRSQAIEQLLLLGHLNVVESTGGRARVRKVFFRHRPLSPLVTYQRSFGCDVHFDQQEDGLEFAGRDLDCPILNADRGAYEGAKAFIEATFLQVSPPMHALVRGVILQFMGAEHCSNERVAAELDMHPRTLRRRLSAEKRTFQQVKDEVRGDLARYWLEHTDMDLAQIAQRLGYAEQSVFTRACVRWFAKTPNSVRVHRGVAFAAR
jgi:AraC-like DNA-binding protein